MRTAAEILAEYPDEYSCPSHGPYATKMESYRIRTACPACDESARKAKANLDREWRIRRNWEDCGLPVRYRNRTFANWIPQSKAQEKTLAAVQAYAANLKSAFDEGRGLILTGDVGTGKTHLLAACAHEIVRAFKSCRFVSVGDLFAEIKKSFGRGREEFDVSELQSADFLLLDDVGASRGTEWELSILHELLRYRYDETLPTLLTTNVSDLEHAVGTRIADRFAENMVRLTIAGSSRRMATLRVMGPDGIPAPSHVATVQVCEKGQMVDRELQIETLRPLPSRDRR
jgi:DNA replication protein DnaC